MGSESLWRLGSNFSETLNELIVHSSERTAHSFSISDRRRTEWQPVCAWKRGDNIPILN